MTASSRYGDVLRFERLLTVYFYTSNADKLLQARLIFARNGYQLRHFSATREPYDEDYSLGTTALLTKAINQIHADFDLRSIFFVEDTSLRVDALSDKDDFPGLRVKEWFEQISFADLDQQIAIRGGNRSATVKSDIALYVPTLSRPLYFHGETSGLVATTPPTFTASSQYPWLTPATFNGWFIPNGSNRRLGEMEFEESLEYDFRAKSLGSLIERLEELTAALNLPANHYNIPKRSHGSLIDQPLLTGLLSDEKQQRVILVVGHKCAGKTTLSDYVASRETIVPIEASKVLRYLASELEETIDTHNEAIDFLRKFGMDCVAKKATELIRRSNSDTHIVSGLRTTEEILYFLREFSICEIVLVDADARVRFERHLKRARDQDVKTFSAFLEQDKVQEQFGVMRVARELATHIIINDGTIGEFEHRIEELLSKRDQNSGGVKSNSELHRCLSALRSLGHAATCEEISLETRKFGAQVLKYNTNRALKAVPEFAQRVQQPRSLLKYRLTSRGEGLLQLLNLLAESAVVQTQ